MTIQINTNRYATGEYFARALQSSDVARSEIFVTSKLKGLPSGSEEGCDKVSKQVGIFIF